MKRSKSKFNKPVNRGVRLYEEGGGLFKSTNGLSPYAAIGSGIGTTLDAIAPKQRVNQAFMEDEGYAKVINKQAKVQDTFKTIENAAISSGNPWAMAGGLAVKGVRMGLTALGVGEGKEERARFDAAKRFGTKQSSAYELAGAQNALPRFQAPAYGKRGMKFKTKFGKS